MKLKKLLPRRESSTQGDVMTKDSMLMRLIELENKVKSLEGKVAIYKEILRFILPILAQNSLSLHITDPLVIQELKEYISLLD